MYLPVWGRPLGRLILGGALLAACAFQLPSADGSFQHIVKSLVNFYGTSLPEKAYLHLDRPYYASGETIWFKAYLVEADSHRADTLSKVLYVELLSGQQRLVAQRTLRLRGGLAAGDLTLPDTLPAGTYQLRAYTNWMRNAGAAFFFTRPMVVVGSTGPGAKVAASPAKVAVQFFPEGGNLVAGLESEVGFNALDEHGHGVAVQGTVLDGQGQTVASFSSRHLGMGSFHFTPGPGQQYRALVKLPDGKTVPYPLPASQPDGYALHVSETADDFVVVLRRRLAAAAAPGAPALLLAQVRGKVVFAAQAPVGGTAALTAKLPKAKFLPGLGHITLFDAQGTAQCERLVLVPNPPGVQLTLTPDKPTYGPRQAVRLRLAATDAAGQPVAGQFSVAVAARGPALAEAPTIVSHLLLSSDLAGVIENPSYYFREPQTPEIKLALNDLLLTQGWRRFVWKELLAGQLPGRDFMPEQGLSVSGQVLTAANQPAVARQVTYRQAKPAREAQMLTDANGRFLFRGLDGLDTTLVVLRAQPTKGESGLRVRVLAPPASQVQLPDALLVAATPAAVADYARLAQQQRAAEQRLSFGDARTVALGTVSVRGQRVSPPTDAAARPYSRSNAVVLRVGEQVRPGDSRTIAQYLQGRVAGVAVSGSSINIRQASSMRDGFKLVEPLYLIDGAIVSPDVFTSYSIVDIQTIDVMNQNAAGIFGIQGYGGVIAAYTRQGSDVAAPNQQAGFGPLRAGALSVQVPGYYRAREFYAPSYPNASPAAPDPRYTTLYWAPNVRTDATGQAQLSFFTSDANGTFQATAEGLSTQGTPMCGGATLVVQGK